MKTERNQQNSTDSKTDATTAKEEVSSEIQSVKSAMEKEQSDSLVHRAIGVMIDVIATLKTTDPRALAARKLMQDYLNDEEKDSPEAIQGLSEALGKIIGNVIPPKWFYHQVHEAGTYIQFSDRMYIIWPDGSYRKAERYSDGEF